MERFAISVHGLSDSYVKWFCGYPSNLQSSVCSFNIFANLWHFCIKLFMFFLGLGPLLSYFVLIFLLYCFSFVYCFVLVYLLSLVFVSCLLSFVNMCLNVVLFIKLAIWLLTLYITKQELNWNQLLLLYYVRYNIAS